jgi:AraC-like DNA-binding protein
LLYYGRLIGEPLKETTDIAPPVAFRYYVPQKPLSNFIGVFWYWRGHVSSYSKERILPMGTAELVINLGAPTGAGISGPQSESVIIERTAQDELLGIHFSLGGAFPFLEFPFGELHGLTITLADLWGERRANELLCRLHEAPAVGMKFQVLEQWLMMIATRPLKHHPAVSFAMKEFERDPGLRSGAVIAERAGFSHRRFIQVFRDEVGLTPKLFCRVQRFHEVIKRVHSLQDVDWLDIALSCGYFDQSHFIHDFKRFSGLTPTDYLQLRTEHPSHVQVRD